MSEIVNLKDYIEKNKKENKTSTYVAFLEKRLKEIERAKRRKENTQLLEDDANTIFKIEKACADQNGIGFKYFAFNYGESDLCMNFITNKYLDTIFLEQDFEEQMHDDFDSFDNFLDSNPNSYLLDKISLKDKSFANYISHDISRLNYLEGELDRIHINWNSYYEFISEPRVYRNMLRKLKSYFRNKIYDCTLYETESIIYLGIKNNIIDKLDKYYILEDEKVSDLAKENDVEDKINMKIVPIEEASIVEDNIRVINDMDEIVKHELSKLKKVKKL